MVNQRENGEEASAAARQYISEKSNKAAISAYQRENKGGISNERQWHHINSISEKAQAQKCKSGMAKSVKKGGEAKNRRRRKYGVWQWRKISKIAMKSWHQSINNGIAWRQAASGIRKSSGEKMTSASKAYKQWRQRISNSNGSIISNNGRININKQRK